MGTLNNNSTWGKVLNIIITVLTAIATTFGVTSCIQKALPGMSEVNLRRRSSTSACRETEYKVRPGKPKEGNKTYPVAQVRQVMNLSDMAKHMSSHSSKYDKGDVMAVATQLTSCIREQLLLGNKVQLGDLGAFSVSLKSKSANNAEEFSTSLIKKVKVRWEPSIEFEDLLNEVTFEYVGTRKAQADARKAEKELLNNMATIQPGQEPDDDGTGDDGGDGNLE